MTAASYHSSHGGMWIDRSDWNEQASVRRLDALQRRQVSAFVNDGYIILRNAAPIGAVDAFQARIAEAFAEGDPSLLYQMPGDGQARPLDKGVDRSGTRIVDAYGAATEALELFTSPQLMSFLQLVLGEPPLLFQSLTFDQGSQQGLHQDTAYVVVDRPMELAACWIALEDVRPGSGELMYAPGSHRNPDFCFAPGRKHWDAGADGDAPHTAWSTDLVARAAAGRGVETFLAKKGDILVWHADLAHGGSPVTDATLSRRSLVGHFCPLSARPNYFRYRSDRGEVRRYGALSYCSEHYDLASLTPPHPPPAWRRWLSKVRR